MALTREEYAELVALNGLVLQVGRFGVSDLRRLKALEDKASPSQRERSGVGAWGAPCYYCPTRVAARDATPNVAEWGGNDDGGSMCPACAHARRPVLDPPIESPCKVTVDFGGGLIRRYTLVEGTGPFQLRSGARALLTFCHPDFGEVFDVTLQPQTGGSVDYHGRHAYVSVTLGEVARRAACGCTLFKGLQRADYYQCPRHAAVNVGPLRVVVDVRGGVAEVRTRPAAVDVVIYDHDECDAGETVCPECAAKPKGGR